jgi:phosphate starvation-inducible PhoH-like protein
MKKKSNLKLLERERPDNIKPLNFKQAALLDAISDNQIVIANGPAGSGKTYVSLMLACQMLYDRQISKLVISRPNVETAKSLGFLPGELDEKLAPYMSVMSNLIIERYGQGWFNTNVRNGNIDMVALGFIQGATYDNAFVLIDEAEHLSPKEIYIILTRLGENSRVVLCGDSFQKFTNTQDGFADCINKLRGLSGFSVVNFTPDDIVRSGICKEVVKRYQN